MEILTSVRRLCIRFKSIVNDFVYSFGRAALLLLVEVWNHTVPVRERRRIRVNILKITCTPLWVNIGEMGEEITVDKMEQTKWLVLTLWMSLCVLRCA